MNPLKPETFLSPGDMAAIDALEAEIRDRAERYVEALRKMIAEEGRQSVTVTSTLLDSTLDSMHLSLYLAYFLLKEAGNNDV